jgi:hypothetical protein
MNSNSGKVTYRKFTVYSGLDIINGSRAVTKMTIEIIMVNETIRYLNFNENAPYTEYIRKIMLRQRCRFPDFERGIE